MSAARPRLVTLGVIGAPHGVNGALHVSTALQDPLDLARYSPFTFADGRVLVLRSLKPGKGARVVVTFEGVMTREAAQRLTKLELQVPRAVLPALDEQAYYHADLIGLRAVDAGGALIGAVAAVHNFGAGDILEIDTSDGALMLAFTNSFVPHVDVERGELVVSEEALLSFQGLAASKFTSSSRVSRGSQQKPPDTSEDDA